MTWLTQYFLNPAFVVPGAALALLPIIIHLLSRLRYKKVRFAAMEFLLQSDELNRRRLIIEQLLLLMLRVLAVLLIMFLIARLIMDPSRMMLLRGAATHHVLVLDDSVSMRMQDNEETVFERAVVTLEKMLSQDNGRSGSLRATVLTTSQPNRPLVTDRELNAALLQELIPRLRNVRCSWKAVSPVGALAAAENILSADAGASRQLHVISDLRKADWENRPEVVSALESLGAMDVDVSLIQLTEDSSDNIVLNQLTSETFGVAVGVPWRLNMRLTNFGSRKSSGLRGTTYVDGVPLPVKILLPDIEPGEEIQQAHDVLFDAPGQHEVEVRLEDDAFRADNSRFVVVEVTDKRAVLIVDDEGRQDDARHISNALSADPELTGIATQIRSSDVLASDTLNEFDCVYLLNVRELPADATLRLAEYVRDGGGLAWFPDDQANVTWYNTVLQEPEYSLFPVPLGTVEAIPEVASDQDPQFGVPVFENHPIFAVYNIPDNPFAELVQVRKWYGVSADWSPAESTVGDVKVLARLQNGDPIVFEHSVGTGRVLTFLISAGRRWSNWPFSPHGYVPTNLLMHQYLQRPSDAIQIREIGEPIRFEWQAGEYTESVEVALPLVEGDDQATMGAFLRLQAAPVTQENAVTPEENTSAQSSAESGDEKLAVFIAQADRPGVFRIKRFPVVGESEETWLAMNVSSAESDLTAADATEIQGQADLSHVRVVSADVVGGISASDAGREMRWFLLALLILVLVAEQLLSLRLSFHPEVSS